MAGGDPKARDYGGGITASLWAWTHKQAAVECVVQCSLSAFAFMRFGGLKPAIARRASVGGSRVKRTALERSVPTQEILFQLPSNNKDEQHHNQDQKNQGEHQRGVVSALRKGQEIAEAACCRHELSH